MTLTQIQNDLFGGETPIEEPQQVEAAPDGIIESVEPEDFSNPAQGALFDLESLDWWREHWVGMPEFIQDDLTPWKSIAVHFESRADLAAFSKLVEQTLTERTRSIWYPEAEIGRMMNKRFIDARPNPPRYPLYIVSKGRHEYMYTSRHLTGMGLKHYIIVEEQEWEAYQAVASNLAEVLVLDKSFQRDYDTCDNLGFWAGKGCSGPARNFAWEHARAGGFAWHWVMDDNIDGFYRLYKNIKTPCVARSFWRVIEAFCERYENVGMAGPNYFMFASRKTVMPPLTLNTRIYSCNLIRTDLPFRWRARYNEDTDLSLRLLKAGWCTVLFNALLQMKLTTQSVPGGNTDSIYAAGTLAKSEMLAQLHPDVARVAERWNRDHHYVDYSPFQRNRLKLLPGAVLQAQADNFGMVIQDLTDGQWVTRREG